jgi:cytochrome c biogenesis protein CcmG/thiol:disulfide interchange protein DsbE
MASVRDRKRRGFLALTFGLAVSFFSTAAVSVATAAEAPNFRLPDLDGKTVELNARRGAVTLVNFWATWCVPCIAELEAYRGLQERHAARGFSVLAISVDQPQTVARVRSFVRTRAFPFPVLLDPDESVYRLYGGAAMPTSVLIDGEGRIVHRKEGYRIGDEADWEQRIEALLSPGAKQDSAPSSVATSASDSLPPSGAYLSSATIPKAGGFAQRTDQISLSGSNFLRANYGRETRAQPDANGWIEDWFDFRIAGSNLAYQARFRGYQFLQDLPDTRENLVRDPNQRIVKQTVSYRDEHADIRAGNFYGTLNRGLVLRMFEDRQARIDRDVKGIWASLQGGDAAEAWGRGRASVFGGATYTRFDDLYAMDADEDGLRDTRLQGVEGEWEPRSGVTLGAQALEAFRDSWHVKLLAGNAEWLHGPTTVYAGYAGLRGEDAFNYPNDFTGRALYAAVSQNLGALELGAEYKYYHNYKLGFAEPPSLVPYHTFRLTARDMPFPNNEQEEGVQARGAWTFRDGSRAALNVSRVIGHPERNPTYLVHAVELPYLDIDPSLRLQRRDGGTLLLALNYNEQRRFDAGFFEDTRAVTAGVAGTQPLSGPWNLQWETELQKRLVELRPATPPNPLGGVGPVAAKGAPYQGVVSATLGRASAWTFTLDYEGTTAIRERDPDSVHDKLPWLTNGWVSAQFTWLALEGHSIALWAGQRKERVICSGGSCRVEPAFEGGELTWISHF